MNYNVFTVNYNVTARSMQQSQGMGVISHKKGKNMLKKAEIFEKLDKNNRRETKFGNFFKKGREGIYRNNRPRTDLQQLQKQR